MTGVNKTEPQRTGEGPKGTTELGTDAEVGFSIEIPHIRTPVGMVLVGAIVLFTAGGRYELQELYVGGGLAALGGLIEFLDRRFASRQKP